MKKKGFKIGLALGGGAARALSHIGVLEGLEAHGVHVDVISGTSMGAIIGAMYARDRDLYALKERICLYLGSDEFKASGLKFLREKDMIEGEGIFFRFSRLAKKSLFLTRTLTTQNFVADEIAAANYAYLVDDVAIEDLAIPFAASALDLVSGSEEVLARGPLRRAIAATCAIPGILRPVEIDGMKLVDGGWINAIPVSTARDLGADFVIAVDVHPESPTYEETGNALGTLLRANTLSRFALAEAQLKEADVILAPGIGHLHWADFAEAAHSIESGRIELDARIDEIRRKIRQKKLRNIFRAGR